MIWVRRYILSIVSAAIICAIVKGLIDEKSIPSRVVKMLAGALLAITVVAPLTSLELDNISEYMEGFQAEADATAQTGIAYSSDETASIIKAKTEAYILDKAQSLGVSLEAEVYLGSGTPPMPSGVTLIGNVSPYAKQKLRQYIEEDLGIPEENQKWL